MPLSNQRRVLVVGGSFAGLCVGRDLRNHFLVTIVDAKEFFEYTPGILRAYVKPKHFDALSFTLQPVIENSMGCKFIWGEVTSIDSEDKVATVVPKFMETPHITTHISAPRTLPSGAKLLPVESNEHFKNGQTVIVSSGPNTFMAAKVSGVDARGGAHFITLNDASPCDLAHGGTVQALNVNDTVSFTGKDDLRQKLGLPTEARVTGTIDEIPTAPHKEMGLIVKVRYYGSEVHEVPAVNIHVEKEADHRPKTKLVVAVVQAGEKTIPVTDHSRFHEGDVIVIAPGTANQEGHLVTSTGTGGNKALVMKKETKNKHGDGVLVKALTKGATVVFKGTDDERMKLGLPAKVKGQEPDGIIDLVDDKRDEVGGELCVQVRYFRDSQEQVQGTGQLIKIPVVNLNIVKEAPYKEKIDFDYCIICSGCNFGPFHPEGQSLWFPTIHNRSRGLAKSDWSHLDERFIEGRRRHILEEYSSIAARNERKEKVLITGAGFIGVEWVTELEHFFRNLSLTIIDMLPLPLGPLPKKAAEYCKRYMDKHKINQAYGPDKGKPIPGNFLDKDSLNAAMDNWWKVIGLPLAEGQTSAKGARGCDHEYVCVGVKASNYFMPAETLSKGGPFGGKWILMDRTLAVTVQDGSRWCAIPEGEQGGGWGLVYAVGDCNYGCVTPNGPMTDPEMWIIPPIPKISYPGEEEAYIAATNVLKIDENRWGHDKKFDFWGKPMEPAKMHWPWGAGMFATSLGPDDACFVAGANWEKNSGLMCVCGQLCAVQKEFIEASKTNECRYGCIGMCIWHFVHHTPLHLWGGGPLMGYSPSWL